MFDVVEHLHHPVADLRTLRRMLRARGALFITTPRFRGKLSRRQGRDYIQFKRDHSYYFSQSTIERLLVVAGFNDIRVRSFQELAGATDVAIPPRLHTKYTLEREHLFVSATE